MIAGIILAAGKGTRFALKGQNKVAVDLYGASPIQRAVQTLSQITDDVFVVIGHESESVISQLNGYNVTYIYQHEQLGTGHALRIALDSIENGKYDTFFVGNGDHMMFYTPEVLHMCIKKHNDAHAAISYISSTHPNVSQFGFGRVLRDDDGTFIGIIEQNDATVKQLHIAEFNAGALIVSANFARKSIHNLTKLNSAGEFYITDLYKPALENGEVAQAILLPFEYVGIGINSIADYELAREMIKSSLKKGQLTF